MANLFMGKGTGRVIVINLRRGDKLLESIRDMLAKNGIKNAVLCSTVGSLQKLVYHVPQTFAQSSDDKFITVENAGPIEIGSLTGTVIDGDPHIHIVSKAAGETHIGHLEEGSEVLYLAEIVLVEVNDLHIERVQDEHGVVYFREKE